VAGSTLSGKAGSQGAKSSSRSPGGRGGERSIDPEKLTNWYNFQARFYHLWRDDYGSPLVDKVVTQFGLSDGPATILDAGCGTGMFAVGLAHSRPQWRIEGIDAADGMLAIAERQANALELRNVTFRPADVAALPFHDACFDGVVAAGLFPNLNDAGSALREFCRVLRPQGRLVIVEFDRDAMSWATKAFVRVMILGYKLVSVFVRKFRFATRWNISTSTIDPRMLTHAAREAGFHEAKTVRSDNHLLLCFERGAR
jgi:ubiquinone/menaquinone biosynthesis C-methylase UbiE